MCKEEVLVENRSARKASKNCSGGTNSVLNLRCSGADVIKLDCEKKLVLAGITKRKMQTIILVLVDQHKQGMKYSLN